MLAVSVPRWLDAWAGMQVGFGLFVGFAVLVGWLIARIGGPWVDRAQARLAREQAGAERYGWYPGTDADGQLHAAGCRIFAPDGHLRKILVGEYQGHRIRMAEFVHTTRGRYLPTTWVNHLIAVELPVRLPELAVGRERVVSGAAAGPVVGDGTVEPGMARIEVESEAFNRRFRVVGADERYASAMLHPRMMEWLLDRPPLDVRISGNLVVAYAAKPWTVPRALTALPVLSGFVDLIPPFVLADYAR